MTVNPEAQVQKNVIDTREWPRAVQKVQIEMRPGEEILEHETRSGPQLAKGMPVATGGGALVLTTERLVVASPHKKIWACDLKLIDRAYLSIGAGNCEWAYAIAFLPPALPLTLLLLLTRRLAVEYRDDTGRSRTTRIHLSRPAYWMERINALKPASPTSAQPSEEAPKTTPAPAGPSEAPAVLQQTESGTNEAQRVSPTRPTLEAQLEQLERLAAFREKGVLTEEEFQAEKRALLDD
jgi:hypothetical protein